MHSKIFQVSRNPIDPEDYITADRYYDWFVGSIADYTGDLGKSDWRSCYKWLGEQAGVIVEDGKLIIESKEKYFKPKIKQFLEALDKVKDSKMLALFSGDKDGAVYGELEYLIYLLNAAYNDKYSFYFDGDMTIGFCTFDEFMRAAEDGESYYLGAVVDYHF